MPAPGYLSFLYSAGGAQLFWASIDAPRVYAYEVDGHGTVVKCHAKTLGPEILVNTGATVVADGGGTLVYTPLPDSIERVTTLENAQREVSRMDQSEYEGRVIVITGGAGTLCSPMARALAEKGACVVLLQRNLAKAEKLAAEISSQGGRALALRADVLDKSSIEAAADRVESDFGRVDALINGAGGNSPQACTSPELNLFDVKPEAIKGVIDTNLLGTVIACQVFGKIMVRQERGVILNIISAAAVRPLTGSIAYAPAKAAVASFTQWLAVHLSTEYSPRIRVNAILPGFFIADHNRHRLIDPETGAFTSRSRTILAHTPMGRFGNPEELVGAVMWLLSDSASFVHGALIPIDGGFLAFGGV